MKTFFHSKNGLHEKNSHKKWSKNFSGKFEEIRAKILRTPKNLPSTPMADITRTLHKRQVYSCGVM